MNNKDPKIFKFLEQAAFRNTYRDDICTFNNRLDRSRSDLQLDFSINSAIAQEDKEMKRHQDLSDFQMSTAANLKLVFDGMSEMKGCSLSTNEGINLKLTPSFKRRPEHPSMWI